MEHQHPAEELKRDSIQELRQLLSYSSTDRFGIVILTNLRIIIDLSNFIKIIRIRLNTLPRKFCMFFLGHDSLSKKNLKFRYTIKLSNSLDPDQARHSVGPDLGQNWKQKLSADDIKRLIHLLMLFFACWVIFHDFVVVCWLVFKKNFSKKSYRNSFSV